MLNFVFFSTTKTVQKYTWNTRTAMEIDLHAIRSPGEKDEFGAF